MKLIIASSFLLSQIVAQSTPFFTLAPVEAPIPETGAPTTAPVATGAPVAITEAPAVVEVPSTAPTAGDTNTPTTSPTTATPVSPAPSTAPTTATPTSTPSTSPTKVPTTKQPTVTKSPTTAPSVSQAPSDAGSDVPSDLPTLPGVVEEQSPQCTENAECNMLGLTGECCPTIDNWTLRCCGAPDVPHYQACANHSKCTAIGLEDACCPNPQGKYLDCCETVPDECIEPGACPLYSAVQYKLDLEAAQTAAKSSASTLALMTVSVVIAGFISFVAL